MWNSRAGGHKRVSLYLPLSSTSTKQSVAHQVRLADATGGARAREAAAAREHSQASAALGRELGSARERLAAVTAELEQVTIFV